MSVYLRGKIWHYAFMCNGRRVRGSTCTAVKWEAEKFENDYVKRLEGNHAIQSLIKKVQKIIDDELKKSEGDTILPPL